MLLDKIGKLRTLLSKHMRGQLSADEKNELDNLINESDEYHALYEEFSNSDKVNKLYKDYHSLRTLNRNEVVRLASRKYWLLAASVIFVLVTAGLFVILSKSNKWNQDTAREIQGGIIADVQPATSKAILKLSDNRIITLDDAPTGEVARENFSSVHKTPEGQIRYENVGQSSHTVFHTLETPKGGYYSLILADGSKVWLNANSSLRFPATFTGTERKVVLAGEAYFEISKQKGKPFIVETDKGSIQVLGTHFNVNSYADENAMVTTLLEGSVKVMNKDHSKIIKPGEQAVVQERSSTIRVHEKDAEAIVSWTKGIFYFDNANYYEVMRQLSRWYDVDVIFEKGISATKLFNGHIEKNIPLSKVLSQLELFDANLRFDLNGRTVRVSTK